MTRSIVNFSAGPAMLPEAVMLRAQSEFMDWQGIGKSVVEISHRSEEFMSIAEHAESTLRQIMAIPEHYHVLFLRGKTTADYLVTGVWSNKAAQIAAPYVQANIACHAQASGFQSIPEQQDWQLDPDAAYCYYVSNETIEGLEFGFVPDTGDVPLVCDMTSSILSRVIDINDYGLVFAGAQKNIAPAGMTVVIVNDELLSNVLPATPALLDYRQQAEADCMLNTPPTFNWYMAGLMFDWIIEQGGVLELERQNRLKAKMLYELIDNSSFYVNRIDKACRSDMNVVFKLGDESLNETFLEQAKSRGLHAIKGHRLAGGMRASLYNAMPEAGVKQLADFMREFERTQT